MTTPLRCACCERPEDACELRRTSPALGLPPLMCIDCLVAWYDGGLTDPEAIKQRVPREAQPPAANT